MEQSGMNHAGLLFMPPRKKPPLMLSGGLILSKSITF
jgi:hypothetical protein